MQYKCNPILKFLQEHFYSNIAGTLVSTVFASIIHGKKGNHSRHGMKLAHLIREALDDVVFCDDVKIAAIIL